ncbi:UNVERIFIED_CONTAM: hypothetical protein FKN15_051010 [Acipenser sinensis]
MAHAFRYEDLLKIALTIISGKGSIQSFCRWYPTLVVLLWVVLQDLHMMPVFDEAVPLDWPFDDGAPPSNQIVDDWLNLLKAKFREESGCCIAVHCVAGLGRAPVLVALALIECGMKYEDAVQFIRQKRRGAFNSKQLLYLEKYRPKMRLRFKDSNGHRTNCCIQ